MVIKVSKQLLADLEVSDAVGMSPALVPDTPALTPTLWIGCRRVPWLSSDARKRKDSLFSSEVSFPRNRNVNSRIWI